MAKRGTGEPTTAEIVHVLRRVRRQMNLAIFDDNYHDILDDVCDLIRRMKSAPPSPPQEPER